jgi:hypothetical protein
MSDQEINQTIADLCDYNRVIPCLDANCNPFPGHDEPPDFCNDLNHMHQVEKHLGDPQLHDEYEEALSNVMGNVGWLFHATARERAEAFLRVLNKWKD